MRMLIVFLCFTASLFAEGAQLQTNILLNNLDKIRPNSKIKLTAEVKNVGDQLSHPGEIQIRFVFPHPLDKNPQSLLFQTEKAALSPVEPGQKVVINFETPQHVPSLFDFIRGDWAMREYQAVISIDGIEGVTGTRAITFSAHYYQGPSREKPVNFSSPGSPALPTQIYP